MSKRGRLLIISYSKLVSDARVLKQIEHFSTLYDVTTCGYGPRPHGVVEHIEVPSELSYTNLYGRFITLRWYRKAYWSQDAQRWSRVALRGRAFDVVLANEVETMPVVLELEEVRGIHLDLHEYTPRLNEEMELWNRRIRPFHEWMCRRYATRADSWSTVSNGLVREYKRVFGFEPVLVTNAAPYFPLKPTTVSSPLALVHSGACLANRQLMTMLEAVEKTTANVTLDLFLAPNDPGYLEELKARAATIDGVTIHDPVPYSQLIETLNAFDLGVHILAPTNFNNKWALPNKLFDYVQARLGIVIGPSPEMSEYVTSFGLGKVASEFTADSVARLFETISADDAGRFKQASDANAKELSAESQVLRWQAAVDELMSRG